eukprot:CAMPEP_0196594734 /NCGR_PEP_ID=MMETSP1081-20130531/79131_1 /TAXON_ID=36882 /ORGANISM="Pyramimonas amylifera, Strain CCMP720" /LENGTH=167 /DNA_ID=CAMNT_0041919077 /DNA_START=24 /DNA_END=527 /DNA_ORIENTATION=+
MEQSAMQLAQAQKEIDAERKSGMRQAAAHKQQLEDFSMGMVGFQPPPEKIKVEVPAPAPAANPEDSRVPALMYMVEKLETEVAEEKGRFMDLSARAERVLQWAEGLEATAAQDKADAQAEMQGAITTIHRLNSELLTRDNMLRHERKAHATLTQKIQDMKANAKRTG